MDLLFVHIIVYLLQLTQLIIFFIVAAAENIGTETLGLLFIILLPSLLSDCSQTKFIIPKPPMFCGGNAVLVCLFPNP